jgi:Protein of unknown function (DUF1592)/Protein of unknown function (DUF1588)/Protein of unknown function (DUF1595)/Protein of unknown function (DUF1587)/Protein of unknown function (DUF1585)
VDVACRLLAASAACCGLWACQGTAQPASQGSGGAGGGAAQAPKTPSQCAASPTEPGPTPIRRLSRAEYNRTVHDLLNDSTAPATQFPGEEVVLGFDNNADQQRVSGLLVEGYQSAAMALSQAAISDLPALLACDPATQGEDACVAAFLNDFGLRIYRRPLQADETSRLLAFYASNKQAFDFPTAVRLLLQAMLQSPHFLYRVETQGTPVSASVLKVSGYQLASRLSYLLWSSTPDLPLMQAAAAGALDTPEGIKAQAERLLADPRAKQAVGSFFSQWLDFEKISKIGKSDKSSVAFPTFTPGLPGLLRQEAELFVDDVFFAGGSLSTLLSGNYTFMNQQLAAFYGVSGPSSAAFEKVLLDPQRRAGVLTQGGFLASHAKADQTSPVQRGLFVREQLLCSAPPPPPANVNTTLPPPDPRATTRERLTLHRAAPACAGCHALLDPVGFTFEHFDGVGLWRDTESGKPVDATGELVGTVDADGKLDGALELAAKLSQSAQVQQCIAKQWFRFGYGRSEADLDQCTLQRLSDTFASSGGNWQALVLELTQTDAFRYRTVQPGAAP